MSILQGQINKEMDQEILESKVDASPPVMFKSYDDSTFVLDSQSGNYTGNQSIFQSGMFASDTFFNWSEAKLLIPGVTDLLYATSVAVAVNSPYSIVPKANNACLIDSILVNVNGVTINNQCQLLPAIVHFKMMCERSLQTVSVKGCNDGFIPDNSDSRIFNATAGIGNVDFKTSTSNNTVSDIYVGSAANLGCEERMKKLSAFDPTSFTSSLFLTAANCVTLNRNHTVVSSVSFRVTSKWLAEVKLSDLCGFFKELSFPVRNLQPNLIINLNQGSITFTPGTGFSAVSLSQGNTMPWGLTTNSSIGTSVHKLAVSIGTNSSLTAMYPSIRLCVPKISLKEEQISVLQSGKREVVYRDYLRYTLNNQAGNASINWNITQGLPRPKRLVVMPFLSASTTTNSSGQPIGASPLDAAPCMTASYLGYTNVILTYGGTPLYQQSEIYDYSQFWHNMRQTLDGALSDSIGTGMLTRSEWEKGYRYLVFDLSRLPSDVNTSYQLNLAMSLVGASAATYDLVAFIEVEKTAILDCTNGQVLSVV